MNKLALLKYKARLEKILSDLKKHPEKQRALLVLLRDNGYPELAQILNELRKEFL